MNDDDERSTITGFTVVWIAGAVIVVAIAVGWAGYERSQSYQAQAEVRVQERETLRARQALTAVRGSDLAALEALASKLRLAEERLAKVATPRPSRAELRDRDGKRLELPPRPVATPGWWSVWTRPAAPSSSCSSVQGGRVNSTTGQWECPSPQILDNADRADRVLTIPSTVQAHPAQVQTPTVLGDPSRAQVAPAAPQRPAEPGQAGEISVNVTAALNEAPSMTCELDANGLVRCPGMEPFKVPCLPDGAGVARCGGGGGVEVTKDVVAAMPAGVTIRLFNPEGALVAWTPPEPELDDCAGQTGHSFGPCPGWRRPDAVQYQQAGDGGGSTTPGEPSAAAAAAPGPGPGPGPGGDCK